MFCRTIFCWNDTLSNWYFVELIFCRTIFFWMIFYWTIIWWTIFCRTDILSNNILLNWYFVELIFCQTYILSNLYFVKQYFIQLIFCQTIFFQRYFVELIKWVRQFAYIDKLSFLHFSSSTKIIRQNTILSKFDKISFHILYFDILSFDKKRSTKKIT
jgi:hypothetical protein